MYQTSIKPTYHKIMLTLCSRVSSDNIAYSTAALEQFQHGVWNYLHFHFYEDKSFRL